MGWLHSLPGAAETLEGRQNGQEGGFPAETKASTREGNDGVVAPCDDSSNSLFADWCPVDVIPGEMDDDETPTTEHPSWVGEWEDPQAVPQAEGPDIKLGPEPPSSSDTSDASVPHPPSVSVDRAWWMKYHPSVSTVPLVPSGDEPMDTVDGSLSNPWVPDTRCLWQDVPDSVGTGTDHGYVVVKNEVSIPQEDYPHPDVLRRHCSWCFQPTTHEVIERHWLGRNTFRCHMCYNETVKCIKCREGMARSYGTLADKLCAHCDRTVSVWGDIPQVDRGGYCSWCFEKSTHGLLRTNIIRRNVHWCFCCGRRTVLCRRCRVAFARVHEGYADELCALCAGLIASWENKEDNLQRTQTLAWCSWCMDKTLHRVEQANWVMRSVFVCTSCHCRTLLCTSCKTCMARGGPDLLDSLNCAKCTGELQNWEEAQRQKERVFHCEPRALELLERNSKWKTKAMGAGMIRPFLLLASMSPEVRNQCAMLLGWTFVTKPYFGDAHQEAWEVISCPRRGIMSRPNHLLETLNPMGHYATWYDGLIRVTRDIFKRQPFRTRSHREALLACRDPRDTLLPDTEETFLFEIAQLCRRMEAEVKSTDVETDKENDVERELRRRMAMSGISNKEVLDFAVHTVYEAMKVAKVRAEFVVGGSRLFGALANIQTFQNILAQTVACMCATNSIALLTAFPLDLVTLFLLTSTALKVAFGPTTGRLFPVMVHILNQRLLLAADGIRIEDFYPQ